MHTPLSQPIAAGAAPDAATHQGQHIAMLRACEHTIALVMAMQINGERYTINPTASVMPSEFLYNSVRGADKNG